MGKRKQKKSEAGDRPGSGGSVRCSPVFFSFCRLGVVVLLVMRKVEEEDDGYFFWLVKVTVGSSYEESAAGGSKT